MNNKELTELKKEFRDTFGVAYQLQRINGTEESVLVMDINYFSVDKVFDFFLPHLKSHDEIKREEIKEFANDILRASIKEIEWCRDNPDKAPSKSFGKGFVKGIEQVTHTIIPQLLNMLDDVLTESKEGGE